MDQEERAQQQALRHAHEMAVMKDQLAEAESAKNSLQNEVLNSFCFWSHAYCMDIY